jgi:glycerophosphoryl diester phosphodiesterase
MKIAAHRGNRLHAPENSRTALVSAYVAGANVLEFDVQLTQDGALVVSHDGDTKRLTGHEGRIIDQTLAELKQLDWSETFTPRDSPGFQYFTDPRRMLAPLTFPEVLDALPDEVELLLELKHDSSETTGQREPFVRRTLEGLRRYAALGRTVVYSKDPASLQLARTLEPGLRLAAFDFTKPPAEQLELLRTTGADGLVTDLVAVFENGVLTPFGNQLKAFCTEKKLKVGVVLHPFRTPGIFTQAEYETLRQHEFIWSVSTDSMLDVGSFLRPEGPRLETKFSGKTVDRDNFALGYAKANEFANVFQDDGIHLDIKEYDRPFPPPPSDPLERKVQALETKLVYTAKDWPYYSGGGVGYVPGIRGDFSAEVEYTVKQVGQATTLEMAVLNVDPGAHVGHPPRSFRDKDSFYDPHGAPPYVGVEHDEDDGFRINWNLGSEYDSNQYGRPVGDGRTPRGARLRLDRRGPYFAAYYRDAVDGTGAPLGPNDWVCVGVVRNDSLNPVTYLRCVGKRWRQESETHPDEFMPILANHFVFKKLTITRYLP